MRTTEPMSWQGHDGLRLVGERRGSGPTVLLLHGGFQNRTSWRAAVDSLAHSGYSAISYDLRGHGESDRSPDADYAVASHAEDLRLLLAHLDEPATLVGASLGGATALRVAGDPSPSVTGLALVDVVPRLEASGRARIREFMSRHRDGFDSLEQAAELVAGYLGGTPRPGKGLTRSLLLGDDGRYRWHWDPAMIQDSFDQYGEESIRFELAAASRIQVPTLVLRGEHSDVISPAGVVEFLAAAPHARYEQVPGVGHMVAAVPNNPFVAAILRFLQSPHVGPTGHAAHNFEKGSAR